MTSDNITVRHTFNCATCGERERLTADEMDTADMTIPEMHNVKCGRCMVGYMTHSNTAVRYTDTRIRDRSTAKTLIRKAREHDAHIDISSVAVISRGPAHELKHSEERIKLSDAVRRTMEGVR